MSRCLPFLPNLKTWKIVLNKSWPERIHHHLIMMPVILSGNLWWRRVVLPHQQHIWNHLFRKCLRSPLVEINFMELEFMYLWFHGIKFLFCYSEVCYLIQKNLWWAIKCLRQSRKASASRLARRSKWCTWYLSIWRGSPTTSRGGDLPSPDNGQSN